jgi:SAM-dependent methyltransferase
MAANPLKSRAVTYLKRVDLYDATGFIYHGLIKRAKWRDYSTIANYWQQKSTPDGLPLPPTYLRWLVINQIDPVVFLDSGRAQFFDLMLPLLQRNGYPTARLNTVLDFGCGCGRLIRYWKGMPEIEVWGTDYNPKLINWCKKHLDFAKFCTNKLQAALTFDDNTFDFIYARSIFTHLSEQLQHDLLRELQRVLKPNGVLLFTVMGEHYLQLLSPEELSAYQHGDYVIRHSDMTGQNECAVFHSPDYVRKAWLSCDFEILDMVKGGEMDHALQDTYLARCT